jgi:hypothetical protein
MELELGWHRMGVGRDDNEAALGTLWGWHNECRPTYQVWAGCTGFPHTRSL